MYSDVVEWLAQWVPEGFKDFYLQTGVYVLGSLGFLALIIGSVVLPRVTSSAKRALWTVVLVFLFALTFLLGMLLTDVAHAEAGQCGNY